MKQNKKFLTKMLSAWFCPCVIIIATIASIGNATPPNYTTFERQQKIEYSPDPQNLLRIWMVFVEQGDGMIIQLPTKYNYDPDLHDTDTARTERTDILIDGGSAPKSESRRIGDFFTKLYDGKQALLEYTILTHHDEDHAAGLTKLLANSSVTFGTIYHNGLASYKPGSQYFPNENSKPDDAVCVFSNHKLVRGMAFWNSQKQLERQYLIGNIGQLRQEFDNSYFEGVYYDLASVVLLRANQNELWGFDRAYIGSPFIAEHEQTLGHDLSGFNFDILWPQEILRPYGSGDWGKTINGNSVVFRLKYGNFEMLFSGDLNKESETALMSYWQAQGKLDLLSCDILKVPHHGSADAYEPFFHGTAINPVISVASMGDKGFRSKAACRTNWQHPSNEVIQWLGGAHRFYSTYAHEQRFNWSDINTETKRNDLIESTHILIETDGNWFRVVELPIEGSDTHNPPTVQETRRGNGTRWINAK